MDHSKWCGGAGAVLTLALLVGGNGTATAQSWVFRHNEPGNDDEQPTTSLQAPDGSVIVAGNTGSGGGMDYLVIKVDPSGQLAWRARLDGGGAGQDILYAAAVDPGGDVFVTGRSNDAGGIEDYLTIKYRGSDGATLWSRR